MRVAAFSDVHGNLAALEAVASEMRAAAPDAIVCLGDSVGYGPDPSHALRESTRLADVMVAGNHDLDVAANEEPSTASSTTRASHAWTRERLSASERSFLGDLPRSVLVGDPDFVAVHASFLNCEHVWGYVTEEMALANLERIGRRDEWPRIGLCGHTHQPLFAWLSASGEHHVQSGFHEGAWPSDAVAVLVNPGSVGQPRDGDPRAAFALIDTVARRAEIHRVHYGVRDVVRQIVEAGLPEELGTRLLLGR